MKKYLSLFSILFINRLQFRAAAFASIAAQIIWALMEITAYMAFYRSNPDAFPMSLSETVSCVWLMQAFLALYMSWFYEGGIFSAITNGSISYELVRPMDLYNRWFCQSVSNRLSRAILHCFPVLLTAVLIPEPYRISFPQNGTQFFLFLLSLGLSLFVVVAYSMPVYISTFYTMSPTGIRMISAVSSDFLMGAIIPLPFFPSAIRNIVESLPFAAMQNIPFRIYSGNISGGEVWRGITLQLFWLVVLVLLSKWFMKKALKKVVVQGG